VLAAALCAAHLAAAGAAWLAPVPVWLKAAITLAIAASLVDTLARKAALHSDAAIVSLEVTDGGRVAFMTRNGEWRAAELLGTSYVSTYLTILNLKPQDGRVRHVVLLPDNVDAQAFRRLRIWLRWAAGAPQQDPR